MNKAFNGRFDVEKGLSLETRPCQKIVTAIFVCEILRPFPHSKKKKECRGSDRDNQTIADLLLNCSVFPIQSLISTTSTERSRRRIAPCT
jgi:hypothetical protein